MGVESGWCAGRQKAGSPTSSQFAAGGSIAAASMGAVGMLGIRGALLPARPGVRLLKASILAS